MKNFDFFIGIDWSGSRAFTTKSISVALAPQGKGAPQLLSGLRSRTAIADLLSTLVQMDKRFLVGIDANFGYASHVGEKHFGRGYTYWDQWKTVDDHSEDESNYYAEGFWSHKKFQDSFWHGGMKPDWFKADDLRRATESQCIQDGYGHPESPFKICYTKQVGKGGLAAQRLAYDLKNKWHNKIAIWPFAENDACDKATLVMTEIYPRQFLMRCGHGTKKVKTAEQLNDILPYFNAAPVTENETISDHDTDALVSAAGLRYLCGMKKSIPRQLSHPEGMTADARRCEGWIFGVGDQGGAP